MKTIDKTEVGKRIKIARERLKKKLTHSEIGKYVGVTRNAVSNWERGESNIDIQHQKPLADILKVKLEWLLFGEGVMERGEKEEEIPRNHLSLGAGMGKSGSYILIPKLSVSGSTGPGVINEDREEIEKYLAFEWTWINGKSWNKKRLKIITARGDSMSPHIENGDIVMVDTSRIEPEDGEIFAFQIDHETRIKRFKKKDDGRWYVICDNPDRYRFPDELASDNIKIIGKKVWRGG